MTKSNHTPWEYKRLEKAANGEWRYIINKSDGLALPGKFTEEEAALIVHRVNNWDKLVEALEFYADVSDYKAPFTGGMGKLWEDCGHVAKQALVLAKEEK